MRHDDPRRHDTDATPGGTPRPMLDPGFTTSIPVVRPESADRSAPTPRPRPDATAPQARPAAHARPAARTRQAGHARPSGDGSHARRLDTVFGRRLAALTLAVVIGAPIAAAIRPDSHDAEAQPTENTTLAVGTAPTTETAAPYLLNPGGAQPTSGTISLDGIPTLTKPGSGTAAAKVAAESTCSGSYTVVSGDSWSYIADKVSVSTSALLAANDANSSTLLLVGEKLCLPEGATAPTTNAPVTTKAPTTTKPPSTTSPPPPTTYYSPAQVEQIIRDAWPDALEDTAILIAKRESKLNPYAHNWCCYGLFQIYWDVHKSWLALKGVTSASQLYDPRINAKVGYWVYLRSGSFAPWGM